MSHVARAIERFADRLRGFAQPWELGCFVAVPAIVLGFTAWFELRGRATLGDFTIFRAASQAVIHGRSPYVAPDPALLSHFDRFVYPPAAAYLFSPLAVVSLPIARVLILVLGIASVLLGLRLLGVRDWRCYGVAAMSAPVVNTVALGALSSFLLLGAAATWRYRDRPVAAGVVASITSVTKLFLWPLGLWLLVTKRLRATVVCAFVTALLVLVGWAAIGFAGLVQYPQLLRVLSRLEESRSYSIVALFGVSGGAAAAISVILVLAAVAGVVFAGRGPDGDRRAFVVAILGALAATPVVWLHYYVLLLVPIALYRPRLSGLWFVPLALWITPASHSGGSPLRIAFVLAAAALVGARVLLPQAGDPSGVAAVQRRRLHGSQLAQVPES